MTVSRFSVSSSVRFDPFDEFNSLEYIRLYTIYTMLDDAKRLFQFGHSTIKDPFYDGDGDGDVEVDEDRR